MSKPAEYDGDSLLIGARSGQHIVVNAERIVCVDASGSTKPVEWADVRRLELILPNSPIPLAESVVSWGYALAGLFLNGGEPQLPPPGKLLVHRDADVIEAGVSRHTFGPYRTVDVKWTQAVLDRLLADRGRTQL